MLEHSKYVLMDKASLCYPGKEITTEDECKDALENTYLLGITLQSRTSLINGSWDHVPYQCSYQAGGDQAFHFNRKETSNVNKFLNGMFMMVCYKGKR